MIEHAARTIADRRRAVAGHLNRCLPGLRWPSAGAGLVGLVPCLRCDRGPAELDTAAELAWCPSCRVRLDLRAYLEPAGWPWLPADEPAQQPAEPNRADVETLDRVYRFLLAELSLSDEHRDELLTRRGLGPETIDRIGFRTAPEQSWTVARAVARRFPSCWQAIPGLVGPPPRLACRPGGLLIPCRDFSGRIFALKRGATAAEREAGRPKYVFVTSAGRGGPGALARASLWLPPGWAYGPQAYTTVRLSEGELKSLILAERTGVPCLSTPAGIATLAAPSVQDGLLALRPRELLVCPDSDAFTKPALTRAVRAAFEELLRLGRQVGFCVYLETWQADLPPSQRQKGADDYLLARPA